MAYRQQFCWGSTDLHCLVRRDAGARYPVVHGIISDTSISDPPRPYLLRCNGCSEECPVNHSSRMEGRLANRFIEKNSGIVRER